MGPFCRFRREIAKYFSIRVLLAHSFQPGDVSSTNQKGLAMNFLASLFLVGAMLFTSTTHASEPYTLYGGFQKGTYAVISQDIKKVCGPEVNINVESGGSVANLNALIKTPVIKNGHRLALVQKDVYETIVGPITSQKPVKMVMPLFQEEILVLVNRAKGIKSLSALNGKKVAGGLTTSGMWFTSTIMEQSLGIKWLNIERSPEESILLLLTGEIDAMIVVGSHPLRLFQELPVSFSQYVDALDIEGYPLVNAVYPQNVTIPSDTYIWQKSPIKTKSTTTYLIASSDVPDAAVKEIKSCITNNLPPLKKMGHPKWKQLQK